MASKKTPGLSKADKKLREAVEQQREEATAKTVRARWVDAQR